MTYNVTSYHMLIKVELSPTPNIKIKVDILNFLAHGRSYIHKMINFEVSLEKFDQLVRWLVGEVTQDTQSN